MNRSCILKIKVLHIIKTLQVGGAETNLLNLVSAMKDSSFDFHVAYSYGGELEQKFQDAGIKLFKYSLEEQKIKSWASLGIIYRLTRYLLDNEIDILQSHTLNAHVWGLIAARLSGCKIVEHVHDARYFDQEEYKRRRGFSSQYKFVSLFKNQSDRVVVLTSQNKDFIRMHKFYPEFKVRQIYNGICFNGNSKITKPNKNEFYRKYNLHADVLTVFSPSRLSPEKNVELIAQVASGVVRTVPNAVFLIAGSGELEKEMRDLIHDLRLEKNVLLIGYQEEIESILSVIDVFFLPSLLELHSIAIMEAMRQEVPVVVSANVGCNDEFIVDGKNGFLCDPFVKDRWVQVIVELLQNGNIRKEVGVAGSKTCKERFDMELAAGNFKDLYFDLAGQ